MIDMLMGRLLLSLGICQSWEGQSLPASVKPPNARASRIQENTLNVIGPVMNGCQIDKYRI